MLKIIAVFIVLIMANPAFATDSGIVQKQSNYSVAETAKRLEQAVKAKGMRVFPRIDHAAAATEYDVTLRPLIVVLFGNPKYGSPLMEKAPISGIDFPPKAVIYEDAAGDVWLAYNSADYFYNVIFKRHGLEYTQKEIDTLTKVLDEITDQAVQ